MRYIDRLKNAKQELRAADAALRADGETRRDRGDPLPWTEDDRYAELNDRVWRAEQQYRAALFGRDHDAPSGEAPEM